MRKLLLLLLVSCTSSGICQEKNFIDKPYIEVQGQADTLVVPNRVFIKVLLLEKDTKNKKSVEDLEREMILVLKRLGIDTDKNVSMQDMMSNYKKYFLKSTEINKSKAYSILVSDAKTTAKIFIDLEEIGISNISIEKVEHSEKEKLQLLVNSKAMANAKQTAESFINPLNQKIGNAIYIGAINPPTNLQGYASGLAIRGASNISRYESESSKYNIDIEFEKIKISTQIGVRFSLE